MYGQTERHCTAGDHDSCTGRGLRGSLKKRRLFYVSQDVALAVIHVKCDG